MSNDEMQKLAEVVRKVIKEENKPTIRKINAISKKLGTTITRLDISIEKLATTYDQVVYLSEKVDGEIIPALELHTKYFKQVAGKFKLQDEEIEKNGENIFRLDKRLIEVESNQGIKPPTDLFLIK